MTTKLQVIEGNNECGTLTITFDNGDYEWEFKNKSKIKVKDVVYILEAIKYDVLNRDNENFEET